MVSKLSFIKYLPEFAFVVVRHTRQTATHQHKTFVRRSILLFNGKSRIYSASQIYPSEETRNKVSTLEFAFSRQRWTLEWMPVKPIDEWMKPQCWQKWTHATHAQECWRETDAIPCHTGLPTWRTMKRHSHKTGKNEPKNRQRIFWVWLYSLRSTAVVLLQSPIHQLSQGHNNMAVLRCYARFLRDSFTEWM